MAIGRLVNSSRSRGGNGRRTGTSVAGVKKVRLRRTGERKDLVATSGPGRWRYVKAG